MRLAILAITVVLVGCKSAEKREITSVVSKDAINVMIIDTGIGVHDKLNDWVQRDSSKDYVDTHGHGTHIAGIVIYGNKGLKDPLCKQVKVYSCKYFDPNGQMDALKESTECVKRAQKMGIKFINYSGGGLEFSKDEYHAYKNFVESGGVVTVAAGNESSDLTKTTFYPASLKFNKNHYVDVKVASNIDAAGNLQSISNSHPDAIKVKGTNILSTLPDNAYGYMSGTSQSSAALMHTILKHECQQINEKK